MKEQLPLSGSISKAKGAGIFCCLLLLVASLTFIYLKYLPYNVPVETRPGAVEGTLKETDTWNDTLNFGARPEVKTRTSWNAPIVWEGMFDPNLYDQHHIRIKTTVALTVFAVGRYLDAYLKTFLNSAEKHFMIGLQVRYYVFTDAPEKVPKFDFGPKRILKVIKVEKYSRWQDISMMRMKMISEAIESEIRHHCTYLFCFDVDQELIGRFGSEALGDSVAVLHAHFYRLQSSQFTYDRNPKSTAFLDKGDFYYHAAIFGGSCDGVKNLADACYLSIMQDKINDVEALWHDESHLNKYFYLHKPSKVLSPEYCWDRWIRDNRDIRVMRLVWGPKNYEGLRTR
ncbi:N-acetyllactosaminide alpha-1,3-galactosyltransferase-like [Anabas testudineus]|nr:N-acetyllactosaminide alpha-1,3-galactosyltransferase-like [Anabas testudineus]